MATVNTVAELGNKYKVKSMLYNFLYLDCKEFSKMEILW